MHTVTTKHVYYCFSPKSIVLYTLGVLIIMSLLSSGSLLVKAVVPPAESHDDTSIINTASTTK